MGKSEARHKEHGGDVESLGKIFVGGLPRDTTPDTFVKHFGQYGEIVDSVIMKDKHTSHPRGFGFITYSNPEIVDRVMEDTHIINGKQVEIKRTIPKDSMHSNSKDFKTNSKDFKTKKIFVGGLPSSLTGDDFKNFFAKYGTVVEHQIMYDHQTHRSRGFGFIVYDSEQDVDDLLANGNMIDLAGSKVEVKKAEPKKSSNPPPSARSDSRSAYGRDSRDQPSGDDHGGLADAYSDYNSGGYGPYRNRGGFGPYRDHGGHPGVDEYRVAYSRYYAGVGGYEGMSPFAYPYPGRFGPYGGGFDGAYVGGNISGYRRGGDEIIGGPSSASFGGPMYGGANDPALGGYGPVSTPDMTRGGFAGGSGRYHPYG